MEQSSFLELTCFTVSLDLARIVATVNVESAKISAWTARREAERRNDHLGLSLALHSKKYNCEQSLHEKIETEFTTNSYQRGGVKDWKATTAPTTNIQTAKKHQRQREEQWRDDELDKSDSDKP